jgi:hypothetical protein
MACLYWVMSLDPPRSIGGPNDSNGGHDISCSRIDPTAHDRPWSGNTMLIPQPVT